MQTLNKYRWVLEVFVLIVSLAVTYTRTDSRVTYAEKEISKLNAKIDLLQIQGFETNGMVRELIGMSKAQTGPRGRN